MRASQAVARERRIKKMQTAVSRHETKSAGTPGIVYRTICQNPGCGFKFDLRITPQNASLLGGTMPCPHCKRHGGPIETPCRINGKLLGARLFSPPTGTGTDRAADDPRGAGSRDV